MQNRLCVRLVLLMVLAIICVMASPQNHQSQYRKVRPTRKPGFFRTLFSVVYEQWSDTKNTFSKVNQMINDNFLPDNPALVQTTTQSPEVNGTTTKAPYRISRKEFNRILQRNLRGLQRLYNLELQDALKQSDKNYAEFRRNATKEISKFL